MAAIRVIRVRLDVMVANMSSIGTLLAGGIGLNLLARRSPDYVSFQGLDILRFTVGLATLIVIHELVHALASMYAGRLSPGAFKFGIMHGLMPYCHCRTEVSVRTYRIGALMPLVITVPLFLGIVRYHPALWTSLLAAFAISGCMGDILIVRKLAGMKADDRVRDCPDEAGCDVFVKED